MVLVQYHINRDKMLVLLGNRALVLVGSSAAFTPNNIRSPMYTSIMMRTLALLGNNAVLRTKYDEITGTGGEEGSFAPQIR